MILQLTLLFHHPLVNLSINITRLAGHFSTLYNFVKTP